MTVPSLLAGLRLGRLEGAAPAPEALPPRLIERGGHSAPSDRLTRLAAAPDLLDDPLAGPDEGRPLLLPEFRRHPREPKRLRLSADALLRPCHQTPMIRQRRALEHGHPDPVAGLDLGEGLSRVQDLRCW